MFALVGQSWPVLLLAAGIALVTAGVLLVSQALRGLQRVGAFSSTYWASFRRFAGYRVRSLRSLARGLLGFALVAAGLVALYYGLVGFYAGRLGGVSG